MSIDNDMWDGFFDETEPAEEEPATEETEVEETEIDTAEETVVDEEGEPSGGDPTEETAEEEIAYYFLVFLITKHIRNKRFVPLYLFYAFCIKSMRTEIFICHFRLVVEKRNHLRCRHLRHRYNSNTHASLTLSGYI